ncbi:MAG: hypothetical protein Sylvanvirus27_2 [Sylvanvirus sp.]|uniref:Uncharacterized protein n=1 Tax=Sylvanvirus sp. TaxID=2487774 RepID=A0A3G5AJ06_9VIRU|nr:MAG: hypothetical protein Sylvanvirus27_2 [Sylvanvirus sp.]
MRSKVEFLPAPTTFEQLKELLVNPPNAQVISSDAAINPFSCTLVPYPELYKSAIRELCTPELMVGYVEITDWSVQMFHIGVSSVLYQSVLTQPVTTLETKVLMADTSPAIVPTQTWAVIKVGDDKYAPLKIVFLYPKLGVKVGVVSGWTIRTFLSAFIQLLRVLVVAESHQVGFDPQFNRYQDLFLDAKTNKIRFARYTAWQSNPNALDRNKNTVPSFAKKMIALLLGYGRYYSPEDVQEMKSPTLIKPVLYEKRGSPIYAGVMWIPGDIETYVEEDPVASRSNMTQNLVKGRVQWDVYAKRNLELIHKANELLHFMDTKGLDAAEVGQLQHSFVFAILTLMFWSHPDDDVLYFPPFEYCPLFY